MRLLAGLLFLTLGAGLALAGSGVIKVRSGEHDNFTRLVMKLPQNAGWTLEKKDRQAVLHLSNLTQAVDISGVFSKVPRTRLLEIQPESNGHRLVLKLGCNCRVKGFTEKGDYLVIDVMEPVARSFSQWDRPIRQPDEVYRFNTNSEKPIILKSFKYGKLVPAGDAPQLEPDTEQAGNNRSKPEARGVSIPNTGGTRIDFRVDLLGLSEQQMLESIHRAVRTDDLQREAVRSDEVEQQQSNGQSSETFSNVSVVRAISAGEKSKRKKLAQRHKEKEQCKKVESYFENLGWDEDPHYFQVPELHQGLFRDSSEMDPAEAIELARLYLSLGYGAEARQVLNSAGKGSLEHQVLLILANVLDGRKLPENHGLSKMHNCGSEVAFWAALADGKVPEHADKKAMVKAFSELPQPLKILLSDEAVRILRRSGEDEAAAQVQRLVGRRRAMPSSVSEVTPQNYEWQKSELGSGDGKTTVSPKDDELALKLAEDVRDAWLNEGALTPGTSETLSAFAFQFRETEIGPILMQADVSAHALGGRFADAISTFKTITKRYGEEARISALVPLLDIATKNASDIDFLKTAFLPTDSDLKILADRDLSEVSERLSDLGFPKLAERFSRHVTKVPGVNIGTEKGLKFNGDSENGSDGLSEAKPQSHHHPTSHEVSANDLLEIAKLRKLVGEVEQYRTELLEIVE